LKYKEHIFLLLEGEVSLYMRDNVLIMHFNLDRLLLGKKRGTEKETNITDVLPGEGSLGSRE
jgi:hypothetical protein